MVTKEELQERAQLVRIHEANCHIEHPTVEEQNFRLAVMKSLGLAFGFREVRPLSITGPARPAPAPTPMAAGKR